VKATGIDQQLAEVFASVGGSLSPAPDLADRARKAARARRWRLSGLVAAAVVVLGVTGVVVAASSSPSAHHVRIEPLPRFTATGANVDAMAVGGNTLYVASSAYPRGLLTAYDRRTGSSLGRAHLPARPSAVAVAPDGTVWVTFSPSNAGRQAGVAEFSADLSQRSNLLTNDRYLDTATFDVMPLGRNQAVLATDVGVVTVTAPTPRLGLARTARANHTNAIVTGGRHSGFGPPVKLVALSDGNVAELLTPERGGSGVALRRGSARFTGTALTVAASPEGLWLTTGVGNRSALRLLSNSLTPLPVGQIGHAVSIPGGADRVWTSGRTVWVASEGARINLRCFVFASRGREQSATVVLPAADSIQATDPVVTGDLTVVPTAQAVYVASPFAIASYPVPKVCQSAG
jgi:hypothetical protein